MNAKPKWWWSRTRHLEWRVAWLEDVVRHLVRLQEQQSRSIGVMVETEKVVITSLENITAKLWPQAGGDKPISH